MASTSRVGWQLILSLCCFTVYVTARKHKLIVRDDERRQIDLSTFGFEKNSYLYVSVTGMVIPALTKDDTKQFGFTLDKSMTSGASPLLDDQSRECRLSKSSWNSGNTSVIYFVLDFTNKQLLVNTSDSILKHLRLEMKRPPGYNESLSRGRRSVDVFSDTYLLGASWHGRHLMASNLTTALQTTTVSKVDSFTTAAASVQLPAAVPVQMSGDNSYSFYFLLRISKPEEEGLYNLIFHNCPSRKVNFTVYIEESNPTSYLSIGQQPLPTLYFVFCVVYIAVGSLWLWVLRTSQEGVFKIHYLMLALMYIKALAMLFHGVNYHFISLEGHQEEAFAVLYYIMYLVKGIFMFVTIVLIGAGWTFVKHVLSDRDKKIFVVIIPLQILANVATIIIEESDEGMTYYVTLKNIFIVIDLICCGAILFPVIWSIRHLQQASQVDGKMAINLKKLKIFRHFYILVVCYIYFTRIIVLLVRIAVRFQFEWLDELFVELATLAFFVLTGYKFRPASNNPYLQLSQSDDETEMDEVVTKSGALETVTKVNIKSTDGSTEMLIPKQRENSLILHRRSVGVVASRLQTKFSTSLTVDDVIVSELCGM